MRGKLYEPTNESSSNTDEQIIQSNQSDNNTINQQQVTLGRFPDEPPPPYSATIQSQTNREPEFENIVESK